MLFGGACVGTVGDPPERLTDGPVDPVDKEIASLVTTRFPRLSHEQWENTVVDLFGLDAPTGLSLGFTGDALGGVFDNNQAVMVVPPNLWADYQVAAEQLSLLITEDATLLARTLPADMPSEADARARAYIQHFGRRAYRRPLTSSEVDAYAQLFASAPTLLSGADDFTLGVRLTLQAFLQSPNFLYRVETSSEVSADGLVHLNSWEVASKLSYMLWNTMPDEELLQAAEDGKLTDPAGILQQAERLLADERAHAMVKNFHAQLYQFDHYHDLYKDPGFYPNFPATAGDDMRREAEMFIDDVVFSGGGLRELLTSTFTYVNADLAKLYGLEGNFGSEFVRVDLDPSERAGLLTRLGFLATNSTPREQNTIHRGVFVNLRVLCTDLPAPPNNVPGLPSADAFKTNRERVEAHTGEGTCAASCHQTLINPPGYALEHYDATGAFQSDEKGNPINASASYQLDGKVATFDGGIELSETLANSETVHKCYAKYMLQYGYGRDAQAGDKDNLKRLTTLSDTGSVRDLLLALTQTKAFRTRTAKEATP